ncbi:MAG: hypothetical protein ACLRRA_06300 [Acutalibacteraceae bacterium]
MSNHIKAVKCCQKQTKIQELNNNMNPKNGSIKSSGTVACFDR